MKIIENKTFGEERALYGLSDLNLINVKFDGIEDGESALKETKNLIIVDSYFNLRYPLWHSHNVNIDNVEFTETSRAAIWYASDFIITNSKLHGIKAIRESKNIKISSSSIISTEFGWLNNNIEIVDTTASGEYFLFGSKNLVLKNFNFKGKYSFQYIENANLDNANLDTKDAFWHSRNVTVKNSVIKGEYLAWYSENLTIINSIIIGTQPFCYANNLKLINCQMIDCDLAFEKTSVDATITNEVLSIKNPLSGVINVPNVKEIIMDDPLAKGIINITNK